MSEVKRRRVNKQAKIKVLVEENPKRNNTLAADRFALYENGMTVGEYIDAGGRAGDIAHDVAAGYIELED